jgi:plastocyanin
MNRHTAIVAGLVLVAIFATAFALPSYQLAFAATVNAEITSGAASKTTDAFSPNPIKANKGDTVVWTNKDTALHTVTSGKPGSPDGKFGGTSDSPTLIPPGKTFQHTFADDGEFPYFCTLHPAMVGTVVVAEGGSSNGGTEGGSSGGSSGGATTGAKETKVDVEDDNGHTYTVVSRSDKAHVIDVTLMPEDKRVGVDFEDSGAVELVLPKSMVSGIMNVTASDNTPIVYKEVSSDSNSTTISFTLPQGETYAEISAATVVPEFGVIAALVLAASLVAAITFVRFRGSLLGSGRPF